MTRRRRWQLCLAAPLLLAVLASPWLVPRALHWLGQRGYGLPLVDLRRFVRIPLSVLPGPPRDMHGGFELGPESAIRLTGLGQAPGQRWRDLADQPYSEAFRASFDYGDTGPEGPEVWLRLGRPRPVLLGRVEARRLKPNFAYQLKLVGDWRDPKSAEAIGYAGRWRLPGDGTNYTDAEYQAWPRREEVEAYLFFDFLVTDQHGHAIRDFAVTASLHVLWWQSQWRTGFREHLVPVRVLASNPAHYATPLAEPVTVQLWAEREHWRYQRADQRIDLPPGEYTAKLVLTEESFHAEDEAGGHWATVFETPISFTITTK